MGINTFNIGLGVFCILIASLADAHAVDHATKVWQNDHVNFNHAFKVFLYYLLSIVPFLYSIRFFGYAMTVSPSIQVLVWFLSTIVFIAFLDRSFFLWKSADQLLGIMLVIGMSLLIYRTH